MLDRCLLGTLASFCLWANIRGSIGGFLMMLLERPSLHCVSDEPQLPSLQGSTYLGDVQREEECRTTRLRQAGSAGTPVTSQPPGRCLIRSPRITFKVSNAGYPKFQSCAGPRLTSPTSWFVLGRKRPHSTGGVIV